MKTGYRVALAQSAQDDLLDGYWFYEAQRAGIGNYFLEQLYGDINGLAIFAGIHAKAFSTVHRTFSKRFPYGIYYVLDGDLATVVAILDTRQNPHNITARLYTPEPARQPL